MFTTRAAAAIALLLLTACTATSAPSDHPAAGAPSNSAVSAAPPAPAGAGAPTAGSAEPRALPIYYVADTSAGFRLYREFHRISTADPASDAVREMLARDSGIGSAYRSYWPVGTELRSPVRHADGVITVDLTTEARTGQVGAELAEMTVQQLVYTAQGALQSTDPVRILINGERINELWGHVATAGPIHRADPYATRFVKAFVATVVTPNHHDPTGSVALRLDL